MKHDGSKLIASYTPDERKPVRIKASDCAIVAGVQVALTGTNDTGITRDTDDNGYVEISYKIGGQNQPGGKWPLAKFAILNDACGGLVRADSTVSSDFRFIYEINFNNDENDDANGVALGPDDEIELWFDDMNANAAFTAATLSVIAVPGDDGMDYLKFFGYDEYTMGAKINEQLGVQDIDMVIFELSSGASVPNNIGILKRGQAFDDLKSEWDYLVDRTRGRYELETAPATEYVLLNFSRTNPHGYVGPTHLNLDGGTGTIYWYAIGRMPVGIRAQVRSHGLVASRQAALSSLVAARRNASAIHA